MRDSVSLRGYTSVILVLNMRRFIDPNYAQVFENIRGSRVFAEILRNQWAQSIDKSGTFVPLAQHTVSESGAPRMSIDEVGFITGIFRQNMLEEYGTPTYQLQKDRISFSDELMENLQFKELFLDAWRRWEIYVRPTMTGMFVVRLTRHYAKATPIMAVASDVVRLQMAFDLPGATQRLRELEQTYATRPGLLQQKQATLHAFLDWMGSDQQEAETRPEYVPVQWKLAMEVCRQLVKDVDQHIPLKDNPIPLRVPKRTTSTPLHDSYVMYHVEELTALALVVNKARQAALAERGESDEGAPALPEITPADDRRQILATPEDVRRSLEIQRHLIYLLEGAILEKTQRRAPDAPTQRPKAQSKKRNRYFPIHRPAYVETLLTQDRATWNDEICLLAPRAAVIIPSHRAREDELFISNFSATTGKVMYAWYWEALERMLEFAIEIRVLAQLMERSSAETMQTFVEELGKIRSEMFRQSTRMEYAAMAPLIKQIANLSRIVGICQGLSNPNVWSRAEYAVEKARHLLSQQGVPLLLEHAERNVSNLTSLLDHVDELYLAEVSERSNQQTFWLSSVLAALSLSITLFALPSFWADLADLQASSPKTTSLSVIPVVAAVGDVLAPLLIVVSLLIALTAAWRALRFRNRNQRRRLERLRASMPSALELDYDER
jgi:hypothetical protein